MTARIRALIVCVALSAGLLASVGAAAAATRYASPSGSAPSGGGPYCTRASPCDLGSAISGPGVADGDTVLLGPGAYPPIPGDVDARSALTIMGTGAAPADTTIDVIGNFYVRNASSRVSNLALQVHGIFGFAFLGTLADRLIVTSSGPSLRTCTIVAGELRDSVCANSRGVAAIFSESYALAPSPVGATIRNVTAVGTGGANGLLAVATTGAPVRLAITNSIVRGQSVDVRTLDDGTGGAASVALDHSSYSTTKASSPDSVTPPGTNANQARAPAFVNPAANDFREAPGSPTIDAGTSAGVVAGERDAGGNQRAQGSAPDIGAYESPPPGQQPLAAFTASPRAGVVARRIAFDASGSHDPGRGGSIASYAWTFGDGSSATGETTSHAYLAPGRYTVRLTVLDGLGRSASASRRIVVAPLRPSVRVLGRSRRAALAHGLAVRVTGEGKATLRLLLLPSRHSRHSRRSPRAILLGTVTIALDPRRGQTVHVRLSHKARVLLAAAKRAVVQAELSERVGRVRVGPARTTVRLR